MPRVHPLEVGLNSIGTLNPSTREISKKSLSPNWFKAYSANVFGGTPKDLHSRIPLQSPVSHLPLPDASKLHLVRAQIRACLVPGGAFIVHV